MGKSSVFFFIQYKKYINDANVEHELSTSISSTFFNHDIQRVLRANFDLYLRVSREFLTYINVIISPSLS